MLNYVAAKARPRAPDTGQGCWARIEWAALRPLMFGARKEKVIGAGEGGVVWRIWERISLELFIWKPFHGGSVRRMFK
jgi:hypothetical protein